MSWVLEFNNVKLVFKFNINELIGRPEFGIDCFVEVNDFLIEFSFSDFRSLDEEGNPVVSTEAVEMSGEEIVSNEEVSSWFINEDDNVDLVLGINIGSNSLVDKSDVSSFLVKSRVSGSDGIESKPSELTQDVLMSFIESFEWSKVLNLLPVFVWLAVSVEDNLIDL